MQGLCVLIQKSSGDGGEIEHSQLLNGKYMADPVLGP